MDRAQTCLLALIPGAYLIGSVPFGLLVGLSKGVDPRKAGSGNIGATNLGRLLGIRFFVLVFLLDMLKGLAPMVAAGWVLGGRGGQRLDYLLWLLVGFAAILGHMFSCFIGFKGGKGVATSCGLVLGLWPFYTAPGLVALACWVAIYLATRYVSVASIAAAILFPIAYAAFATVRHWPMLREQLPLLLFAVLVAVMIVYKHRSNIARLRAGTEGRFRGKAESLGK